MADSIKSQLILTAKQGRHLIRRVGKQLEYHSFHLTGTPKFFANSFPKSGTHWLTQVMEAFPLIGPAVNSGLPAVVIYERESGREASNQEILTALQKYLPGDFGYGHLHARPELVDFLTQPDWCTYFIIRDPRDIVVSHVFYVTDIEPKHVLHNYYTKDLKTFDERLKASILGRPDGDNTFLDINSRFLPYENWMNHPEVLSIKYEDALANQSDIVRGVVTHAQKKGFTLNQSLDQAVQTLLATLDPKRSPTFRQGKSGGWRKHFTPEITRLFKDVAGDLLIRLGYEKDLNW
jgi:sulfotransferase 6B1